ncbi:MAG TPA: hypothetical protein PK264_21055 [Hyphomicrobiaceae bacterium]|nr:hypothetical protein [Hyphomicrobiaceae bacterium]
MRIWRPFPVLALALAATLGGCGDSSTVETHASAGSTASANSSGNGGGGGNGSGASSGARGNSGSSGTAVLGFDKTRKLDPKIEAAINTRCDRMWGNDPHREVCVQRHTEMKLEGLASIRR